MKANTIILFGSKYVGKKTIANELIKNFPGTYNKVDLKKVEDFEILNFKKGIKEGNLLSINANIVLDLNELDEKLVNIISISDESLLNAFNN